MFWSALNELIRRVRGRIAVLHFGLKWIAGLTTGRLVTVRVFHNTATDANGHHLGFSGYQTTHPMVEVWHLPVAAAEPIDICEAVFRLLNVGDDPDFGEPDPRAIGYRQRGNRSLSVGDCLAIRDRFYAVASTGFDPIEEPTMTDQGQHGSTPLWAPTENRNRGTSTA